MRKSIIIAALIVLCMAASAFAQSQLFPLISADELKKAMDQKTSLTLVDARSPQEFAQGHITGSINISPDKFQSIVVFLPKNKGDLIVFYCRGFS